VFAVLQEACASLAPSDAASGRKGNSMSERVQVSLLEAMRLELAGAERRFGLALRALKDFDAEHAGASPSRELAASFARQRAVLEIELDAARRRYEDSLVQLRELEGA
jgi:hypothetical protein